MTSRIYYPSAAPILTALTVLLALAVPAARGHSVAGGHGHEPGAHGHAHHTEAEAPAADVAGLIKAYSISGDDELLTRGWRLVEPALAEPTPQVWLHAAWLAQAQHRFRLAQSYVRQVLQVQPHNPQAQLLDAAIAGVTGDHGHARKACRKLTLSLSPVVASACLSRVVRTADQQIALLQRLKQMSTAGLEPSLAAWVHASTAELAVICGDHKLAEQRFLQALHINPTVQIRAAYVDLLASRARHREIIEYLSPDESTPALAVRRLMALQQLNQDINRQIDAFDRRFRDWIKHNDYRHAREMGLFFLHLGGDAQLALDLAIENIKLQRESEDLDLLQQAARQASAAAG